MSIEFMYRYLRQDLHNRLDALFVFGDNMDRAGFGGQAKACRGEPNAVGVPTKWAPHNGESAFFVNADFDRVKTAIDRAFDQLQDHLRIGGVIVFPLDGIGTGLAELPLRAPKIYDYIVWRTNLLREPAKAQ